MVMTDCSFLDSCIADFNDFFTKLARSEQGKESDDTQEDISSTIVTAIREENELVLSIRTNKNNNTAIWLYNYYIMAKSLFPDRLREYLNANPEPIIEQLVSPLVANFVGGVSQ